MSDEQKSPQWEMFNDWFVRSFQNCFDSKVDEIAKGVNARTEVLQQQLERDLPKYFATREEVDALKAELLQVRALVSRNKSWWR